MLLTGRADLLTFGTGMHPRTFQRRSLILGVALGILGVVVFYVLDRPAPPEPLPDPNGYDDVIAAGKLLVKGEDDSSFKEWKDEQLRAHVKTNAAALSRLRQAFAKESRAKTQFTQAHVQNQVPVLLNIRASSRLLRMEGLLAERENRHADASQSYLDCLRLGHGSFNGGLLIDALLGTACMLDGSEPLNRLATNLDATTCRKLAAEMERLDGTREPTESVMNRERRWGREAFTLTERVQNWFDSKPIKALAAAMGASEQSVQDRLAKTRHTMMHLASRAYELEKGRPPVDAGELVPDYLKSVPRDPTTGTNLTLLP